MVDLDSMYVFYIVIALVYGMLGCFDEKFWQIKAQRLLW